MVSLPCSAGSESWSDSILRSTVQSRLYYAINFSARASKPYRMSVGNKLLLAGNLVLSCRCIITMSVTVARVGGHCSLRSLSVACSPSPLMS